MADIDDGLYMLNLVHTSDNYILSYDENNDQLTTVRIDAKLARRSVWYIHKMANHDSHEIHLPIEDRSLRGTSGGIDLASGDSDANSRYRWNFTKK